MDVVQDVAIAISREYQVDLSVLTALERNVTTLDPTRDLPAVFRRLLVLIQFYVEYERSATTAGDIRDKLMPYFRVAGAGYACAVIFICETRAAADLFRQQHRNLQRALGVEFMLITSTYDEVVAGEFEACWNLNGNPVTLIQV